MCIYVFYRLHFGGYLHHDINIYVYYKFATYNYYKTTFQLKPRSP